MAAEWLILIVTTVFLKVPNPSSIRRWAIALAVLLVPVLVWLSWQRLATFDWAALGDVYNHIDWRWMIPGAAIIMASYISRVLRWQVMLRPVNPNSSFRRVLVGTLIGFTAIVLLGRPGELVRPYLIARSENVSVSSQMGAWLLERIYDLLAILILFGFGLATFDPAGRSLGPALLWVLQTGGVLIAVLCGACLLFLVFAGLGGDALVNRLREALAFLPPASQSKIGVLLESFSTGLASCQKLSDVSLIVFYTIIEWGSILAAVFCIFRSFPQTNTFSLLDVIVYLGFVSFGSIVQIPGVGGGVQIVTVLVLTQLFGVQTAPATGIAIASWLATWVVVLPFGIVLAARQGLSWGSLKSLGKDLNS